MEDNTYSKALCDSIKDETTSLTSELLEMGLDAFLDDGIFKDIPFVSTVVSLFQVGKSITERHNVRKLIAFINGINNGVPNEEKRQEYISKINENSKYREQQIEYLLILIDAYIDCDKPKLLAKIYLAYLDDKISWDELTLFAETIDRLLPGDVTFFVSSKARTLKVFVPVTPTLLRLSALGLYEECQTESVVPNTLGTISIPATKTKNYNRTAFGNKLHAIISE